MKALRFCFSLILVLGLAGCAFQRNGDAVIPDERAGPSLVIYFAEDGNARRAARAVARKTGGELFDIRGKKPLPDLRGYDTFFVTASLEGGRIPAPLKEFLERTDFIDGRVVPFWTSRNAADSGLAETLNGEFERIARGARLLPAGGVLFAGRVKAKDADKASELKAEAALNELGLRRAAGGDRAEDMAKLFAAAYGGRFGPAVFQDGDWTLEMDGARWYYAQGRFLTKEDAERTEDFRPQFLYRYMAESSAEASESNPWRDTANQIISRRAHSGSYSLYRQTINPGAVRSPFFDALWRSRTRGEAYAHQKWIDFLGRKVQVHEDIVTPLGRAEARIQEAAKNDPKIPEWLGKLDSVTGWNWRNVAGSASRSFHAYGAAVDLLMKAEAGMETYWQWTAAKGIDWRAVPAEKRQNPPLAVIRAFEDQGFIWGGRWSRYDTMHFEYHPELLIFGTGNDRQRV
ncbi:MAG: M15 family metallopeptidase [Spirochaetaceae bacterium]|nr:M15 family metallopeptidase [Spirochaetaceae bacterium]